MEEPSVVKPYPTLKQTWGLLAVLLLITLFVAGSVIVVKMALKSGEPQQIVNGPWFMLLLYTLQFTLIILFAFMLKKRHEPNYSPSWKFIGPGEAALIAVITVGLTFLVDPITDLIPMPEFLKKLLLELLSDRSLPTVLMLVVAAPICEELLFRGIILDGLLKNYAPKRAIIWSAFFFGIAHLNPWQFIAALVLGGFMGWVYWRTGSLWATLIIHFIANGSSVLIGSLIAPTPNEWITTRQLVGNDLLYLGLLTLDLIAVLGAVSLLRAVWFKKSETLTGRNSSEAARTRV